MYADTAPCSVCGSEVRLEPHTGEPRVGTDPDGSVDLRVCTNADCESHGDATASHRV